jgi:hypothetical protein
MPKDAKGHGSNPRYHVVVQPYSLAEGKVGQRTGAEMVVSKHKSFKAAGNRLGSVISGKRKDLGRSSGGDANRLFVRDSETGHEYSRNSAKGGDVEAAAKLREGSMKSGPVDTHSAMAGSSADTHRRVSEAEGAMSRLRTTFHQGNNKHGEYGRNTREAFDRHAKLHAELTGKPKRNIYD